MKKLIASILTLCMVISIVALGWGNVWLGATAETAETTGTVEDTGGTTTDAGTTTTDAGTTTTEAINTSTTENVITTDSGTAATETPAPEVTEPTVATDSTDIPATTDDSAAATVEPDATDAVVTAEPTAVVEPDVGTGPAWVVEGAHRRYGELDELLPIAMVNKQTIYLCSASLIELSGYTVDELRTVSFGLDEGALGEEFCDGRTVIVSTISPSEKTKDNTVFIWVGRPSEVPSPEKVLGDTVEINTDESAQLETEIMVQTADYTTDAACAPTFTLTAYPEMSEGMTFAVIVNDGDPQAIVGNTYAPTADGVYRFAVLDAEGTLKARSIEYSVTYSAPEATEEATTAEASTEPTVEPTTEPEEALLTQMDILSSVELAATETSVEEATPELSVRTYSYVENSLSDQTPSFELSGAPDEGGYYYGISINGSAIYQMRDNLYAVTKSGDYTLLFYLLDADGNTVSQSGEYHVIVDYSQAEQDSEAWMSSGEVKLYGTLSSLLRQADSGSTIYLLTSGVIALTDTSKLASVNLAADPTTYGEDYGVVISDNSPDGDSAEGTTYVWVGVDVSDMQLALFSTLLAPTFTIDSVSIGSRTLSDGMWVNGSDGITFSVTDTVVGNTYTYEVSTDGGVTFTGFSNGGSLGGLGLSSGTTYNIVFRLTGADDASNVVTAAYSLKYDNEAPVLICKAGTDNTLSFYAGDSISGFGSDNNVTFNATASPISWSALLTYYGQNVYTYSVQYKGAGTIAAGTLAVRDIANNVAVWGKDIVINSGTGGGGSMSGGGIASGGAAGGTTTTRTVYHSASTYTTVTAYNGVELAVENGTMNTLTIGDQQLDLSLKLDGTTLADGTEPSFKADFVDWKGGSGTVTTDAVSDDASVDTLVLTAADATLENGDYCWTFDGSVYKKLAASGIDYLVLNVGDNATALSTAGFAAGIRYNMYRAAGLASKAFVYTVRMNASTGSVQIQVAVSGDTYTLTTDQTSEFYYYDVYTGTMDMLNRPFGQEGVQGTAADGRQG